MANTFYVGGMSINEESINNRLNKVLEERKQDSDYIITYGLGAANVSVPSKDTIIIKGKDYMGNGTEKVYTTIEVLDAIMRDLDIRIRKYIVGRDGYYRFCRKEELLQEGIEIQPLEAHRVFYNMVVDEYNLRHDEQMKYLKNELTAEGLTVAPELLQDSKEFREEKIREIYGVILRSDIAIVLYEIEATKRIYANKMGLSYRKDLIKLLNQYEEALKEEIIKYIDEEDKSEHLYTQISTFSLVYDGMNEFITSSYNAKESITDQDVIAMLESFLGKESIADYVRKQPNSIIERRHVVRYLIKNGYITEEELKGIVDKGYVYDLYKTTNNPELLKYMLPRSIFRLYTRGRVSIDDVIKYTSLSDLITDKLPVEEKMKILTSGNGKRIYKHSESDIIWEYFEKNYFSVGQMAVLEGLKYFHLNDVIRNYQKDKERKIAAELHAIPNVSEECLFKVFSPEIILRELRKGVSDEFKDFYNIDLKRIYDEKIRESDDSKKGIVEENKSEEDRKDNLEHIIIEIMLNEYKEDRSKDGFYQECIDLYDKGFLSLGSLVYIGLPESMAAEYISAHNDDKSLIIDFFNANLVSQDYIMDIYPDDFEQVAFNLISDGMSARVLSGMYSTGELINYIDVIGLEGLAELKEDINLGIDKEESGNSRDGITKKETTILSLYIENNLSYEQLKAFADAGIISEEEFNSIEEKYNVSEEIKRLKEEGLFSVIVYGEPEKKDPQTIQFDRYGKYKKPEASGLKMEKGIDRDLIKMFYEALGMEKEDFIAVDAAKCPIFDGYMLITDEKRRLCYLEGDKGTRTYIVPLKYVIDQVGESKSRSEFAKKITNIGASANHTANWGKNMIDKIAALSSKMTLEDKKDFKEEHGDIIQAIADSYKDSNKNR